MGRGLCPPPFKEELPVRVMGGGGGGGGKRGGGGGERSLYMPRKEVEAKLPLRRRRG